MTEETRERLLTARGLICVHCQVSDRSLFCGIVQRSSDASYASGQEILLEAENGDTIKIYYPVDGLPEMGFDVTLARMPLTGLI